MLLFGAGDFWATPLVDAFGNNIANPTPIRLGVMQEMSLEFSGDTKELYGQNQFPVDVGRGKAKVGGKCKNASIYGKQLNNLYFGQTQTGGSMRAVYADSVGTAVPATPFQITAAPPSSGTWVSDGGVKDENGTPMTRVAATPGALEYTVANGVYTFNTAQQGKLVYIDFLYSYTLATGQSLLINNVAMGNVPVIQVWMQLSYKGQRALVEIFRGNFTKLQMFSTKLDDHNIPELDFSAYADSAGKVARIWLSE